VGTDACGKKKGMGLPFLLILFSLVFEIVSDCRYPLPADRIRLDTAAFFHHR